jgi:hypothetical protein
MVYTEDFINQDDDLDYVHSEQDLLIQIRALGEDIVSPQVDHPDISRVTNRDSREMKQLRRAVCSYLQQKRYDALAIWKVFEAVYSGSFRVNGWTGELVPRTGSFYPPTMGKMLNKLEDALGRSLLLPKDFLDRRLQELAEWKSFNPVKDYLLGLPEHTPEDLEAFNSLASRLFGTSDHLSQVKLSRWLIGSVARAMEPGCKMDTALVIRGKQGIGKTSLLQALFGDYFRTLHSHQSTLEQQRVIQQAWGCELGELEATFRAKDISALKAFLTETNDSFRDLYQNEPKARPRHCVFAGTTNEAAFLNDPTGSRRFWVIDVGSYDIPVSWAKANRDRIWAVAYHLWQRKEQYWLTRAEEELSELSNKAFQTENSFEEPLRVALDILEDRHEAIAISASDALTHLLGIKPEQHRKHSRELASAMESLGYIRKQFKSKAMNGWFYIKPGAEEPTPFCLAMRQQVEEARQRPREPRKHPPG